jgi:hypothetical protein
VKEINGRIMLNIGSLGVETNEAATNFVSVVSVYEGEGAVA